MAATKNIFITSGDVDGIGLEVATKALLQVGSLPGTKFILYGDPSKMSLWKPLLRRHFSFSTANHLKECLQNISARKFSLHLIESSEPPVLWVKEAAGHCLKLPKSNALVTGPLSKTGIKEAGLPYIGHTELLKKISGEKNLFQVYLGSKMNVLLVTDHISLAEVPKRLTQKALLQTAIQQALTVHKMMKLKGSIAFLALDPHAGESGLIGSQDSRHLRILKLFSNKKIIGPIPADTAFAEDFRREVGLYIALYHDQGLIPFKALHGFSEGVHLTAGLPFVRTSVDHGTAKNLYGMNKAEAGSMIDAIKTAIKMIGK